MSDDVTREPCTEEDLRTLATRLVRVLTTWRNTAKLLSSRGQTGDASALMHHHRRLSALLSVVRSKRYAGLFDRRVIMEHRSKSMAVYVEHVIASFPGGKIPGYTDV